MRVGYTGTHGTCVPFLFRPGILAMNASSEKDRRDAAFMEAALSEASKAAALDEVPVGAVVVLDDRVVSTAHNLRRSAQDPTAHAEILALRKAATRLGTFRLTECTVYVTLEPCPMCAGALVNARVRRLVYGCRDPKAGAVDTLYDLCRDGRLNHRLEVREGVLADRCAGVLSGFFARLRHTKKDEKQ